MSDINRVFDEPASEMVEAYPEELGRFASFLRAEGLGIALRLDIKMTCLEELKIAATLISELKTELHNLAFDDNRDPTLRVMLARTALQRSRQKFGMKKSKRKVIRHATHSVNWPVPVGGLDRPHIKGPKTDSKGEK